jgi:hypothetical protein
MRLSELNILPMHEIISVEEIWVDGVRYKLADDGDLLLEDPPTEQEHVVNC